MNSVPDDKTPGGQAAPAAGNGFPAPGESPLFDTGLGLRKAVLGNAYVERSIEAADDFTRPLQKMITEWC